MFEVIERAGVSTESFSQAVRAVVAQAHAEKPVAWFEVIEQRGRVQQQGQAEFQVEFQVKVKLGRKLS